MISFLKLHRKAIALTLLAFIFSAFVFQAAFSFILNKSKSKIINYLHDTFGYAFRLDGISFNFPNRLHLHGLSIFYDEKDKKATIHAKNSFISIKLTPLFFKKIVVSKIKIDYLTLWSKKIKEGLVLQIIFGDIYKKSFLMDNKSAALQTIIDNLSISVRLTKIIYANDLNEQKTMPFTLRDIHIVTQKTGRVISKGSIRLAYQVPKENYISRFLNNRNIIQDFRFNMQGNIDDSDFKVDMLLVNLGKKQIILMGLIKDFIGRNPYLDFSLIPTNIPINSVSFLQDNFNLLADIFVSLKLIGRLDNLQPLINLDADNCNFSYRLSDGEKFDVNDMRGKIIYKDKTLRLERAYLKLNNIPLNIEFEAKILQEPDIFLKLLLPKYFLIAQELSIVNLEILFKGKIKRTLIGDLEIKSLYKRGKRHLKMSARFNKLDFDYYNLKGKYLKAEKIELTKIDRQGEQKLNFINFDSRASLSKNYLNINNINFTGYQGIANGRINIDLREKAQLKIILNGRGLNVEELMQDLLITKKLLSGKMDVAILFNNHLREFLIGTCKIINGRIDLDTLAEIIRFPSLKNIGFNRMQINFAILKDLIRIRSIGLSSPDIVLNAYWNANSKINGALDLRITTELLRNSAQFKKLINLTKMKEPYIDFRFQLGGFTQAIRFIWLKGEFKKRIEEVLSPKIRKSIETSLNKAIDDLSK